MNPKPIRDLIARHESESAVRAQGVATAYDVVWGSINRADMPPRPLTQMTVAEVLAWQDSIDRRYRSEAAGRYQILEDTLRGLKFNPGALFDETTQDALCDQLLVRRGWNRLCAGEITTTKFADSLAREWASLPVTSNQRGQSRDVAAGMSFYAGDNLNKAHATVPEVLAAINLALTNPVPRKEEPATMPKFNLPRIVTGKEKACVTLVTTGLVLMGQPALSALVGQNSEIIGAALVAFTTWATPNSK